MLKEDIKALTFDTGGTILDWHTGFKNGFETLKKKYNFDYESSKMANLMRKKSLSLVTSQKEKELINFDIAHQRAVNEINNEFKLGLSDDDKLYLYYTVPCKLNAWKDFKNSFLSLKEKFLCVSFTLLSNRLVFKNSKYNKISWDLILSCETLEIYKPDISAYLKTSGLLQIDSSACAMVACHCFDLNAAKKAGFKTIFVKRLKEWGEDTEINIAGDYDLIVEDFNELKESLC